MKYRYLALAVVFIYSFSLKAQSVEQLSQKAEKLYEEKEFQSAAEIYEQLLQTGYSAELYYNYASTQFRLDNLGSAILFYERALALSPNDKDILYSLEFAQTRTIDKIDQYEDFFLVGWLKGIGKLYNADTWAIMAIILFVLSLSLGLIFLFSSRIWLRKIGFFVGVVMLFMAIVSLIYSFEEKKFLYSNPYAIVQVGSVSVKASPIMTGKELFVIHEGTKVCRIGEEKNGWQKIEISDRRVGWIPSSAAEGI